MWFSVSLGAAGVCVAVVGMAFRGELPAVWLGVGVLLALVAVLALNTATARVSADTYGVHSRTLLRRRSVPWGDLADLRIHLRHEHNHRVPVAHRVGLVLRDGRHWLLPLPRSSSSDDRADFDTKLDALRTLHAHYGSPESIRIPVISRRTAGHGSAGPLSMCLLLLAAAGLAAWLVPNVSSHEQAWQSAVRCTARTPESERHACLSTVPAVIAKAEAGGPEQPSWLYFADRRPQVRLAVSREGAQGFESGDSVELTFWHGRVREIVGDRHVWREHLTPAGDVAVIAAALALAAGYPGARVLLRLRARRLPDDEVLPSAFPFAGVLVATALWLLPLCSLHPTALPTSPVGVTWAIAGSVVTLGLCTWAWRATRVRLPGEAGGAAETTEEVFLAARFLEDTDYNPHGFGTHIVLGHGPPAVSPHPGPGRFAARRVPVERLTVQGVRRLRGADGDIVPRSWHIAELDDAGQPVRLAAAPGDLTRIVRELSAAQAPADAGR